MGALLLSPGIREPVLVRNDESIRTMGAEWWQ